ncbi:hypothetical protein M231_05128 [Tremella mesenterica]|uniref:C2H2-type domain-containing protein n=1 Tax=Tremella mesenterica TaxID=5217 RepID=A0A4Q1BIW5_TREME|nr:hypothetical protein M231_05128 [Tremella mesenterica]
MSSAILYSSILDKSNSVFPFPSPPPSITSEAFDIDHIDGFDFDTFTHSSSIDDDHSLSFTISSPESNPVVSPRTSFDTTIPINLNSSFSSDTSFDTSLTSSIDPIPKVEIAAAEKLSEHHLLRYLHYKTLADQSIKDQEFYSSFVPGSMQGEHHLNHPHIQPNINTPIYKNGNGNENGNGNIIMSSFPTQPTPVYYQQSVPNWNSMSFPSQPNMIQAQAQARAQAQAHMQAHADAFERARSLSMSSFYTTPVQTSFENSWIQQPPTGQTQSMSIPIPMSTIPNSIPSTPLQISSQLREVVTLPTNLPLPQQIEEQNEIINSVSGDVEVETEEGMDEGEEELSHDESLVEHKPTIPSIGLTNLHGGGRGYVPGQTPDDPKKRHKCTICGRGFARAFNLKSHVQTHNPLRPKPHTCPHSSCKRGFSRLHDLERHRQGIHSDGPLAEAKKHGVAPSTARAQGRIQRRSQSDTWENKTK